MDAQFTEQVQIFEPVQKAEPSHFTEQVQTEEPIQNAKPSHFTEQVQNSEPVQKAEPSHSAEQIQNTGQSVQTIFARNCEVRKIDKRAAEEFLSMYHSYGDASCRHRYGLFLKRHTGHNAGSASILPGTLVAVATFSNARKWIKGDKTILSYE